MTRRALGLIAILLLTASACAPFAQFTRDLLDSSDGATLTFVMRTPETEPGIRFDPDGRPALTVVIVATGDNLTLLRAPDDATCTVNEARMVLDCRIPRVDEPVTVYLTGARVLANASYRREGSNVPRLVFAP